MLMRLLSGQADRRIEPGPLEVIDRSYSISDSGAGPTHPCAHPDGEDPMGQHHLPATALCALSGPEV